MLFPHPMIMFPGASLPVAMPEMPMPQAMPADAIPASTAPVAVPAAADSIVEEAKLDVSVETKPKKEEKQFLTIKLLSFAVAKKINVVKEVRAVTQLGLKEAKELVEGAPKIVKKGVPAADAEAMRDKLVAAGAEVALE